MDNETLLPLDPVSAAESETTLNIPDAADSQNAPDIPNAVVRPDNSPEHQSSSSRRPKMNVAQRAKQFMPFMPLPAFQSALRAREFEAEQIDIKRLIPLNGE